MCSYLVLFFFFFFKQKTAYEMRISDWSSDVCSSDLLRTAFDTDAVLLRYLQAYRNEPLLRVIKDAPWVSAIAGKHHAEIGGFTLRSEERRVGKECVSTCRSRWSPYH